LVRYFGREGSLTQSVGYRRSGGNSATTTTRLLIPTGPVYVSGAVDVDRDGADLAAALLVPIRRSGTADEGVCVLVCRPNAGYDLVARHQKQEK